MSSVRKALALARVWRVCLVNCICCTNAFCISEFQCASMAFAGAAVCRVKAWPISTTTFTGCDDGT